MSFSIEMKRLHVLAVVTGFFLISGCYGFRGLVIDKETGTGVPGAVLTFSKENAEYVKSVTSNSTGFYIIDLPLGRYWVTCGHRDYEDYTTHPGFFVVTGRGYQTGNFFLRKPVLTTVILIRHAEKMNSSADPDLSPAGEERAKSLTHVLWKAGVTGVYATSCKRSLQTVGPLADSLRLAVTQYGQDVVDEIMADHRGDVVLVASHSQSAEEIIRLFGGGSVPAIGDEYDNMFILSRTDDQTQVVDLQYGNSTPPDVQRGGHPMKTLILATPAEAGAPGAARMDDLAHVLKPAGIGRIYQNPSDHSSQSLIDDLNAPSTAYDPVRVPELVEAVRSDAAQVVLIIGQKPVIEGMLNAIGAAPFPAVYPGECDNLLVETVTPAGKVKSVNLQYGGESP
jgi:broad specificity phosphatase PhoE